MTIEQRVDPLEDCVGVSVGSFNTSGLVPGVKRSLIFLKMGLKKSVK